MAIRQAKFVLVVEDEPSIANLLQALIESETGYQTILAANGRMALALLEQPHIYLVLLDVYLPDMSGIDIYDAIQLDPLLQNIPVLFVTAAIQDPAFRSRGFKNIVPKPFDIGHLLDVIERLAPLSPLST